MGLHDSCCCSGIGHRRVARGVRKQLRVVSAARSASGFGRARSPPCGSGVDGLSTDRAASACGYGGRAGSALVSPVSDVHDRADGGEVLAAAHAAVDSLDVSRLPGHQRPACARVAAHKPRGRRSSGRGAARDQLAADLGDLRHCPREATAPSVGVPCGRAVRAAVRTRGQRPAAVADRAAGRPHGRQPRERDVRSALNRRPRDHPEVRRRAGWTPAVRRVLLRRRAVRRPELGRFVLDHPTHRWRPARCDNQPHEERVPSGRMSGRRRLAYREASAPRAARSPPTDRQPRRRSRSRHRCRAPLTRAPLLCA